jgi:hypothetical protein
MTFPRFGRPDGAEFQSRHAPENRNRKSGCPREKADKAWLSFVWLPLGITTLNGTSTRFLNDSQYRNFIRNAFGVEKMSPFF